MGWARSLLWLFPRRLRSYWLLLAITSFGIFAAVTLMAVGAIYSRALAEGGLPHILATTSDTPMNPESLSGNGPWVQPTIRNSAPAWRRSARTGWAPLFETPSGSDSLNRT